MTQPDRPISLLLVDDEPEFRQATARILSRRGFSVREADSGERALEEIAEVSPDVVILDLKMPGMGGLSTLTELRKVEPDLPVVILTGHGRAEDVFAGMKLEIVDFLQKPVDVTRLCDTVRALLAGPTPVPLREKTLRELLVSPESCPRVYEDAGFEEVLEAMQQLTVARVTGALWEPEHRAVLVFDRQERFLGVIRLHDVLRLVVPSYLALPQASYLTGMFLAELKTLGRPSARELLAPQPVVEVTAPLMEAVHLMRSKRLTSLPVMEGDELVGLVVDQAIFHEVFSSVRGAISASR